MTGAARSRKIRYAVVGLGHIAQAAVLPAFARARRNSVLHALVSGDADKLDELGDRYQVKVRGTYDDFETSLKDVDAVYIATPNTEHAEFAVRAAQAGVHVLCEKPLAVTEADCERMVRACREAGVRIMTAYRLHFEPLTLEVIDLVRRGRIGEPRYFSSEFSMVARPANIRTQPETGGGTLWDLGVYCINAARMLFGVEPTEAFAYSIDGARSGFEGVDETTSALLRFAGDRLAVFTTSFGAADASSYRIVGTEGDIRVNPAYEYAEPLSYSITRDGKTRRKKGKKQDQFAAELLYFSDCLLEDREPEPSAAEGAWDVRIVDALYESARTGRVASLPRKSPEPGPERDQAISRPASRKPAMVKAESPRGQARRRRVADGG